MKHQFIIDCESADRLPDTNVTGTIAEIMTRVFLRDVTITRCRINDVDEPVVALALLKGMRATAAPKTGE